jgi:hypothetical protein
MQAPGPPMPGPGIEFYIINKVGRHSKFLVRVVE